MQLTAAPCGGRTAGPACRIELGRTVERVQVHAIERDVHDAREEALDENAAAEELAHEIADGAVLAQRTSEPKSR